MKLSKKVMTEILAESVLQKTTEKYNEDNHVIIVSTHNQTVFVQVVREPKIAIKLKDKEKFSYAGVFKMGEKEYPIDNAEEVFTFYEKAESPDPKDDDIMNFLTGKDSEKAQEEAEAKLLKKEAAVFRFKCKFFLEMVREMRKSDDLKNCIKEGTSFAGECFVPFVVELTRSLRLARKTIKAEEKKYAEENEDDTSKDS